MENCDRFLGFARNDNARLEGQLAFLESRPVKADEIAQISDAIQTAVD